MKDENKILNGNTKQIQCRLGWGPGESFWSQTSEDYGGTCFRLRKKQVNGSEEALSLAFLTAFLVATDIRAVAAKPGSMNFLWLL